MTAEAAGQTKASQTPAELSDSASRVPVNPRYASFFDGAEVMPYSHDNPYADSFSVERASAFLDRIAVGWGETFGCVTCHTNGFYLTAPNAIFPSLSGEISACGAAASACRVQRPTPPKSSK